MKKIDKSKIHSTQYKLWVESIEGDHEKYIKDLSDEDLINGDLEHFDCIVKKKQAYLWDNLFMANSNINCRVKGTKPVNPIMKPDTPAYDPFIHLQFDDAINRFIPNINLLEHDR